MDKNHNGKATQKNQIPREKLSSTFHSFCKHQRGASHYSSVSKNENAITGRADASCRGRNRPNTGSSSMTKEGPLTGSTQAKPGRCSCSEKRGTFSREPPVKNKTSKESSLKNCSMNERPLTECSVYFMQEDLCDSFKHAPLEKESCKKAGTGKEELPFILGENPLRRLFRKPSAVSTVKVVDAFLPRNEGRLNFHSKSEPIASERKIKPRTNLQRGINNGASQNEESNLMNAQRELARAIPEGTNETPAEGAMLNQIRPIRCGVEDVKSKSPRSPKRYGRGYILTDNVEPSPGGAQLKTDSVRQLASSTDPILTNTDGGNDSRFVCKGRVCQSKEQSQMLLDPANDSGLKATSEEKNSAASSDIWISLDFIRSKVPRRLEQEQCGVESRPVEKSGKEKSLTTLSSMAPSLKIGNETLP